MARQLLDSVDDGGAEGVTAATAAASTTVVATASTTAASTTAAEAVTTTVVAAASGDATVTAAAATAAADAAEAEASASVAPIVVVASSEAELLTSKATTVPRAFVLAPSHKNAFLNRVRLSVESWANKPIAVGEAAMVTSPNETDFPHRLRWEKAGPPMRWVETFPRRTNLIISMRSNNGSDGALFDDEEVILKHGNALLPAGHPKLTELRFVCYLIRGDAESGYDPKSRPHTSIDKSMFKNPLACLSVNDNTHSPSFFHHGSGAQPVSSYKSTMNCGKVIFKNVCFSATCLTSNTLNASDGVWRLCIRSTHPALTNLINFMVVTPPFSTGRRVRPIKIRKVSSSSSKAVAAES